MSQESQGISDDFLLLEMEITRPITHLKALMSKLLSTHNITATSPVFLKGIRLSDSTTLVSSCVVKTGQVLVRCRIKPDYEEVAIEIDDVLLATTEDNESEESSPNTNDPNANYSSFTEESPTSSSTLDHEIKGYLWKVDPAFTQEQAKRKMPSDPLLWSAGDVRLWLGWARSVFRSSGAQPNEDTFSDLSSIFVTGPELCLLPREKLYQLVLPKRTFDQDRLSDLLFAHFTLLKQQHCIYRPWPLARDETADSLPPTAKRFAVTPIRADQPEFIDRNKDAKLKTTGKPCLWRFILDCLTEPQNSELASIIHWGDVAQSEFVIAKPEKFAALWSDTTGRQNASRNGKPTSTESVARALRMYALEGVVLSRISTASTGQWTYRFVADLEQLIGYSAAQLQALASGNAVP